jgi:four helix bundle protein
MRDDVERMRTRTKAFALNVLRVYESLPHSRVAQAIGYQAFRSGTSVGAQDREACRSRSDAELVSKLESTLQEVDETEYWLELLVDDAIVPAEKLAPLIEEANELIGMFVTAVRNIKKRR